MCWNWEVSLGFTIFLASGSLWIFRRQSLGYKSTERDRWYAPLVLNLAFVQFWEFCLWFVVHPMDEPVDLCPKINQAFTVMVYFHGVLAWPPIVNMLAWKTTQGKREYFLFPLFYGLLYTFLGAVDLAYTRIFLPDVPITCGLRGEANLKWEVALSKSRILPGGFDWFVFTVFPFIFYKPRPIGMFMFTYLIASFVIPYLLLTLGEAASVFCWLGFALFIVYLFEPYVIQYVENRYPILLTYDPISTVLIKLRLKKNKGMKRERLRSPITSRAEDDLVDVVISSKDLSNRDDDADTIDTELGSIRESNEVELP